MSPFRRDHVCVCSLEYDEAIPRVRVWSWTPPALWAAAAGVGSAEYHHAVLRQLREHLGHARLWIDRADAPAVALPRALDYLTFAEQRAKARQIEQREHQRAAQASRIQAFRREEFIARAQTRDEMTHIRADLRPPVAVHQAAPVGPDGDQRCARCGALLKCQHLYARPLWVPGGHPYAPGELIERGPNWQAITFQADAPTCVPAQQEAPTP